MIMAQAQLFGVANKFRPNGRKPLSSSSSLRCSAEYIVNKILHRRMFLPTCLR
eukprot:SAG31_NODE_39_length_31377_cov_5.971482_3_plen_53_part_00